MRPQIGRLIVSIAPTRQRWDGDQWLELDGDTWIVAVEQPAEPDPENGPFYLVDGGARDVGLMILRPSVDSPR